MSSANAATTLPQQSTVAKEMTKLQCDLPGVIALSSL